MKSLPDAIYLRRSGEAPKASDISSNAELELAS